MGGTRDHRNKTACRDGPAATGRFDRDDPAPIGDTTMSDDASAIAENRRRYEELKRAGQGHAPRALPGPSPRGGVPLKPVTDTGILQAGCGRRRACS